MLLITSIIISFYDFNDNNKGDKRNSSPLFDEVSSDGEDFEVMDRGGGRRHVASTSSDGHCRNRSHTAMQMFSPVKESISHRGAGQMEEEEEGVLGTEEATVVGPRTPVNEDGSVDDYSAKPSDDSNSSLDTSIVEKLDVETSRAVVGGEVGPKTPPPPPTQTSQIQGQQCLALYHEESKVQQCHHTVLILHR